MMEITPAIFYLGLAVALIGAELVLLQLSVFWFLFFGLGALVTAVTSWLVPLSWVSSTTLFLIASLLITVILYPALRKWQNKPAPIAGNDAIGQRVKVIEAVSNESSGKVQWSGSDWTAELSDGEESIKEGETAYIVKLEGIRLFVGRKR